ncbi:RNA methyltransferase [Methylogaea oryzae]|uniref:RNA methyltransferase n=1 Tax=Methylogaea oryzae TaxID=1295382 RepID=UPI000AFDB6CE|nr:TrmH family RNA methyltransferase [Methylogaea oryzae]
MALANIRIVMVETSHPGNIGAAARAMKNMGLSDLCLVRPRDFPSAEATARASGADDVLSAAQVCDSLEQAIADCQLVVGASARDRWVTWPELTARACAETCGPNLKPAASPSSSAGSTPA